MMDSNACNKEEVVNYLVFFRQLLSGSEHAKRYALAVTAGSFLSLGLTGNVVAQVVRFDQKYVEAIQKNSTPGVLDENSFGEQVDFFTGSVQFNWVDIDLPSNSGLPVSLHRQLVVEDKLTTGQSDLIGFGQFGSLDLPFLKGVHGVNGWRVKSSNPLARCSAAGGPPAGGASISASDYWGGNWMHIPGNGDQLLLYSPSPGLPKMAGSAPLTTKNLWAFECLPTTANGYAGEAFMATSPAGVRYYFDYVITKGYPALSKRYGNYAHSTSRMSRVAVYFLASKVEDRFGNWVSYTYVGDKLSAITSNDGRYIRIDRWDGDRVKEVSSSSGRWTYEYPDVSSFVVNKPDASRWRLSYTGSLNVVATPSLPLYDHTSGPPRCPAPELSSGEYGISVTSPAGSTARYVFSVKRHYHSNVPRMCNSFIDERLMSYKFLTIPNFNDQLSIASKTITGPGLPVMSWIYQYSGGGGLAFQDICENPPSDIACPQTRYTEVTGPGQSFKRYVFGNMYKKNAGQLLAMEEGWKTASGISILRTTTNSYVDATGQPYPDTAGSTGSSRFDDVRLAGFRPLQRTEVTQDGIKHISEVLSFDSRARPLKIQKSSGVGL